MRFMGHNVIAIIVAAVAIWAIGFIIYVLLFQQQWMQWMGVTEADMQQGGSGRMPFMLVMPFLQAIGLSLAVKWRGKPGWMAGMTTGMLMAVFIAIAARMYGWVYSTEVTELFAMDSAHFFLTHAAAGAILGAWK